MPDNIEGEQQGNINLYRITLNVKSECNEIVPFLTEVTVYLHAKEQHT